ncbi:hypothetical protein [Burkholderia cepacia]|uniref:hypothetical protein n=1 Tax=Burkholderia cepacia TaxID=292 RepID=UPI002ABE7340|nr:hypothetical protein [Burkholderia cepacia]
MKQQLYAKLIFMFMAVSIAGGVYASPGETSHSLNFENTPEASDISVRSKTYTSPSGSVVKDEVFQDGLGREAYFRGWNVSGESKLWESEFLPFRNLNDAKIGISKMADATSPNLIRFLILWEGVNPQPDKIDYRYLDRAAEQMKVAIARKIHILIDYHEDLFSRYLFPQNSSDTGEGAPAWVIPGRIATAGCPFFGCGTWAGHTTVDSVVRGAAHDFWNNAQFTASNGKSYNIQDVFIWQMRKSLAYLKTKFTPEEFNYIIGVDPFNEPFDGGMDWLSNKDWENQKLWPFYERTRVAANEAGWDKKFIFSEPLVFWNANAGAPAGGATGGGLLNKKPGKGFVFNTHFYDSGRRNPLNPSYWAGGPESSIYFDDFDKIRSESRFRENPVLLSEFGAAVGNAGPLDTDRMIKAMYQAAEASNAINGKTRYVDFYSNPISGTEWHWDYYYDHHHEYNNGNPNNLLTTQDGWNGENYSVAKDYSNESTVDSRVIDRAYPRRVQGDLMNFYYNDSAHDASGAALDWAAIKPDQNPGAPAWFNKSQFILVTWRGRKSDAPTEIALPVNWKYQNIAIITDTQVHNGDLIPNSPFTQTKNEIALTSDSVSRKALRALIWTDPDPLDKPDTIHFALLVNQDNLSSPAVSTLQLQAIRDSMINALCKQKRSVVYLGGEMASNFMAPGYPPDSAQYQ